MLFNNYLHIIIVVQNRYNLNDERNLTQLCKITPKIIVSSDKRGDRCLRIGLPHPDDGAGARPEFILPTF